MFKFNFIDSPAEKETLEDSEDDDRQQGHATATETVSRGLRQFEEVIPTEVVRCMFRHVIMN